MSANSSGVILNKPQYTRRWFPQRTRSTFEKHLLPFAGKPLLYVEIGVFEARSLRWMLTNVLTHPDSRALGIDPWDLKADQKYDATRKHDMTAVMERAEHNVMPWSYRKASLVRADSAIWLRSPENFIEPESIDILYIDGDHKRDRVIDDINAGWPYVKVGGRIIFDDYENRVRKRDHVKQAVDEYFLPNFKDLIEPWYKDRFQIAFVKVGE